MLLVSDYQCKIPVLDILTEEGMSADDKIQCSVQQLLLDFAFFLGRCGTGEQSDPDPVRGELF